MFGRKTRTKKTIKKPRAETREETNREKAENELEKLHENHRP